MRGGDLNVKKIDGKVNPADLLTKHLDYHDMQRHVSSLGFETSTTCVGVAPKFHGQELAGDEQDEWDFTNEGQSVMRHVRPRCC